MENEANLVKHSVCVYIEEEIETAEPSLCLRSFYSHLKRKRRHGYE
jgi:hypothetical protein